jgi:excisionase family DNA binding protein
MTREEDESAVTDSRDSAIERWQRSLSVRTHSNTGTKLARDKAAITRPRTVQEAAEELGLSVHTIRAWIANRRLSHLRLGRSIRIPAAEIARVIEESTVPAVREE